MIEKFKYKMFIFFILFVITNFKTLAYSDSTSFITLYPICVDNKVGYINQQGEVVIEPMFDTKTKEGHLVLKDKELECVIFPKNAFFSEGKATVRVGKWFYFIPLWFEFAILDSKTFYHIKTNYFEPNSFKSGLAVIRVPQRSFAYEYTQKFSYIKEDGFMNLNKVFQYASNFHEEKALVLYDDLYGYIDNEFEFIIPPQFEDAGDFSEGLAYVKNGEFYEFINEKNEVVINSGFKKVWCFKNGFSRVFDGKKYSYINKKGENQFKQSFVYCSDFSEGLALVKLDSVIRYIDTLGHFAFEKSFNNGNRFNDDLAAIEDTNGKWGFINNKGEIIINPIFEYAENFENGLAFAWFDSKMYYINKKGEFVSEVYWKTKNNFWIW